MERIDTSSAVARKFVDPDPGAGRRGTVVDAKFLNAVQEELVGGLIEQAGLPPSGAASDQVRKAIMSLVYPVGSVYITQRTDVTPFQLFGIGTWEEISKGRVPVGLDPTQVEFNAVGKIGGAKTVVLGIAQMPSHRHFGPANSGSASGGSAGNGTAGAFSNGSYTEFEGGGQAHDNLQPYEVIGRIWRRTA